MVPLTLAPQLEGMECRECGGRWIPAHAHLAWLKAREENPALPEGAAEPARAIQDNHDAKICPDCDRILIKYKIGQGIEFFLDRCTGCGGIWFDPGEWQAIRGRDLHKDMHLFFTSAWQNQLREDQLRHKLEGIYRERFGAESYEQIKAIREWIQNHPQKNALVAFLTEDNPYKL